MLEYIRQEIPLYERMGVFMEAPRRKKRKPKVYKARTTSRGTDFTADVEPEEEMDMATVTDDEREDFTSGTDEGEELQSDDPDASTNEPSAEEGEGNEDFTAGADDETNNGSAGDETQPGAGDEPQKGAENQEGSEGTGEEDAGEDFTAGADDDGENSGAESDGTGNDGGNADATDTQTEPGQPKPFKKEDMKKFVLFNKFVALHTSIGNYVSKLEISDANDAMINDAHRELKQKFKDLESLLHDYMILKFASDSYVSNKYFYEQVQAAVLILFQLLLNVKTDSKKGKEKERRRKLKTNT